MVRSEEIGKAEGEGGGDVTPHPSLLTPHVPPLTLHDLNCLRWRCRRGMLELDLPLARFLETHYHALTEAEKTAFSCLLDYSDPDLWELVRDGRQTGDEAQDRVVALLREEQGV